MRGEHCIAGASVLTLISVILLVFANIGQISPGAVTSGLYMVQVDVSGFGNAVQSANKKSNNLYWTQNTPLGQSKGLRQYYRYGLYNACGYQKSGGVCNATTIGYPFAPFEQMLADTPSQPIDYKKITQDIIPSSTFKNNGWNGSLSRSASSLIFVASILTLLAFVFGLIKLRFCFLIAAGCAGLGAFFLMIGAAIWTSIIAKNAWLSIVKVQGGVKLGIVVTPGPALYLTWVSFVLVTISVAPYVISCCTYRKPARVAPY
ncbi:hypothetical protein CcaverHIS002_0206520 [Cutaneotrichosporon cavernicola]|uniref:Actin cortical patch SUR7/pH-response regulator pali n=1 Tax=Cutaneotrichosporon cavernicola TaxID=279322 RepID=A0AA48L2K6_9TREE|nr:uncharacterized protein CcaverHIS019_0206500 [Cutaneotrichosporon cavernicola]BEI81492.1 hypothetical protein CcaverHIS002_0206520 [Cutaneotrichosporon cavernicola]BEI89288.1 hypothetical protein CcaverHIS019_0206500 [Cutaneotrichosporon cavernicola]BEI97064.1 hypothetical protein CcaverHIS631_0206530 [Cutaneotrichosporon cavernicola]BEJ04837.1 hypothetical protein CcaverHIS641_0206540 [Cutaneotrichosporon cavernicola]